ncbi:DUF6492 family protein [Galbitalea soli]|uniref:Uncharacterized protein n=1 Tax=Galbitalea soli TaxID=1268042 RepID=A0A7C9TPF0_9MICO|nr:hypothetical protein [Galbitalea soli]NYJ30689.1 hypothetical protein [Galbitalea soli]
MAAQPLAFVTVVFESEFALLELQARSMARFLPSELAAEIVVIDNSARGMSRGRRDSLLDEYGPLRDRVRILRPRDIVRVPLATGWRSQQVLKLCVVDRLRAEHYVVLDAKNHFVATVAETYFWSPEGRLRGTSYGYRTHPLQESLVRVLDYLGVDSAVFLDRFTATVTPFALYSGEVRRMIADVTAKAGRPFAREFVTRRLTEFFLYSGWIVASGRSLDEVYDLTQAPAPAVWPKDANPAGIARAIEKSDVSPSPVFSIHRRAIASLAPDAGSALVEFWTGRGLFPDSQAARAFLDRVTREVRRAERWSGARNLPIRAISAARSVARRPR